MGHGRSPRTINRRVAVLWDEDSCFYPAVITNFKKATGESTLHYSDGDIETLDLDTILYVNLPSEKHAPCGGVVGGKAAREPDSPVCGKPIDLSQKLLLNSKHVICSACTTAFHFSCAADLKCSLQVDKSRRPPRLAKVSDAASLAKWRCPKCESASSGAGASSSAEKRGSASGGQRRTAERNGAKSVTSKQKRGMAPFRGPSPHLDDPTRMVIHDVVPDFAKNLVLFVPLAMKVVERGSPISYSIPSEWKTSLDALAFRYLKECRSTPEAVVSAVREANMSSLHANTAYRQRHAPSQCAELGVPFELASESPDTSSSRVREALGSASGAPHTEFSPNLVTSVPSASASHRGASGACDANSKLAYSPDEAMDIVEASGDVVHGRDSREDPFDSTFHPPLFSGSAVKHLTPEKNGSSSSDVAKLSLFRDHADGTPVRVQRLDAVGRPRLGGVESDPRYPSLHADRMASEMMRDRSAPVRSNDVERSNPAKTAALSPRLKKFVEEIDVRPRKRFRSSRVSSPGVTAVGARPISSSSVDVTDYGSADASMFGKTSGAKRLKAERGRENLEREKFCYFCKRVGSIPECEGELLGPFRSREDYAHRNCLVWAPDTVEVTVVKDGKLLRTIENYEHVFMRARRQKCIYCRKLDASLSCVYMRTKCCKPLHFRCALLAGASLFVSQDHAFLTFCPRHKAGPYSSNRLPHDEEHLHVQTPVGASFFEAKRLCVVCHEDNFDTDIGPLIECANCKKLAHVKCALSGVDPLTLAAVQGAFAVDSHRGFFYCHDCVICLGCKKPLLVDGGRGISKPDCQIRDDAASSIIRCVGCKMPSGHLSCVPMLPPDSLRSLRPDRLLEDVSGDCPPKDIFRCERCRRCRHCDAFRVPLEGWHEGIRACSDCTIQYKNDAVCPVCDVAYLDDEDNMILCDGCEKWVHVGDCSGLTEEEIDNVEEADFFCTKCKPPRRHGRTKAKAKAIMPNEPGDSDDEGAVVDTVEEEGCLVNAGDASSGVGLDYEDYIDVHDFASEAAEDVAILATYRVTKNDDIAADVVPHVDLCRRCGSGGEEELLRFCTDCGDAVHGFCLAKPLPRRSAPLTRADHSIATLDRFTAGGVGFEGPPWRCDKCASCEVCEAEDSNRMSGSDAEMCICSNCGVSVHRACAAMCDREPSSGEAALDDFLLCSECSVCELCMTSPETVSRHDHHLFCDSCWHSVSKSKPCPFCHVRYPSLPVSETLNMLSESDDLLASTSRANFCSVCKSLVHWECDSLSEKVGVSYVCSMCSGKPRKSLDQVPREAPSLVSKFCKEAVSEAERDSVPDFLDPLAGTASARSGPVCPLNAESAPSLVQAGVRRPEEGSDLVVKAASEVAKNQDGALQSSDKAVKRPRTSREKEHQWSVGPIDDRICELCSVGEESSKSRGRLLPWMGEVSPSKLWWVHAVCAIWSSGVRRVFPELSPRWQRTCFLVADRRWVAALRSKVCLSCNEPGATIACAHEGCAALYHYKCADNSGCRFQAKTSLSSEDLQRGIELKDVAELTMSCKDHCGEGSDSSTVGDDTSSVYTTLSESRRLRLDAAIRFSCHSGDMKSREGTVLRAGGLTVLRFGQVMANSPLFFEGDALVPSSYRAVRRHWSLKNPGKRCTLLMDIGGTARTGPVYTLRFSDDPETIIVASSAAAAWDRVTPALEQMRLSSLGIGQMTRRSLVLTKGTSIFGLSNCEATVAGIEALPLSFLLRGRHSFMYGEPEIPGDFPFPVPKLSLASPDNVSGCARVEGYVPKRHPLARISAEGASYRNVPSGECFQMHVAMGLGGALHEAGEDTGVKQVVSALAERAVGSAAQLPRERAERAERVVVGGNGARAVHLPHSMQHRVMSKTWKRRTVILRSGIEGWGVYATEDIAVGDMVIEYMGEIIRPITSDEREAYYDSQGIGCYMFEVAPGRIVDATMLGNRARFINHSCEPNCFSRTVAVEHGRRVIVIFAKRNIKRGEELCYDYQFPLDAEDRVACACGSAKCKGFMN